MFQRRIRVVLSCACLLLLPCLFARCAPDDDSDSGSLTVYSGRNERLIGPLLERFREATGIEVHVRYGSTSELTATLMEEGENTPAQLFISQDAAALGALSRAGMLRTIPQPVLELVEPSMRSSHGDWVGLSGRARVVVYNTELITPDALPQRLEEVTAPRYRGKFGIAPGNASFQAHIAMYGALNGEAALREFLDRLTANKPQRYPKNSPIVEAVINGEIEWGLVNHYYLWRALKENPEAPAKNFFMRGGNGSHFLNLAGAAILQESSEATQLIEFMLGSEAQSYFAEETYEYPIVAGVDASVDLPSLSELPTQQLDYQQVAASLDSALEMIQASGLLQFN